MTVTPLSLALYAGALGLLWLTPGPVWVALTARALSGGFASAWPLALGVTLGDLIWPLVAIFGLSWIVDQWGAFMTVMRYMAAAIFILMGWLLIRHAGQPVATDGRLTRPGRWAGLSAGIAAILGNPKAILFYMGVLPGFFDLRQVTAPDIALIAAASMTVPLVGNLFLAALVAQARGLLKSPRALWRINVGAGGLLIAVGALIAMVEI
ncbi:LysE family translocator [Defluviimonas sp. SAOS-178_SWC]|uniref:LysE family translocator n=1 Tax=Defluviimonas sp. SAOS-178_SWC TaxID=3121287 RepID=UPI00322169C4